MATQKHTVEVIKPTIEIEEDLKTHEKGWIVQKIGYVFFLGMVLLGAIGVFGDGWVSKESASSSDVKVTFEQFFRNEAQMQLRIDVSNVSANSIIVSFPNNYLGQFRIESIQPSPKENMVVDQRTDFHFNAGNNAMLLFFLVPQQPGNVRGEMMVNNSKFQLHHFIYP